MSIDALQVLDRETAALATALVAARDGGRLDAPVHGCPDWSLADLGRHTGGVHRWAAAALVTDRPPAEPTGPAEDDLVPGWYAEGAAELRRALVATPPGTACWTFDRADRTAGFWRRRQAHEAALHRWDAESALHPQGTAGPRIDSATALDGVDEVLTVFLPRQVRLGRCPDVPGWVGVVPDEDGRSRAVSTAGRTGAPVGQVAGSAEALLLLLWRRIALDDHRLVVTGDVGAVRALLDRPLTP
ncbi:maleylpyruvate isomerase N-terminal domain-containing protein [Klenkia sp. PcliD-1-E]|uniref:maleylpyruvate isomerase N-terminal domain-containing protein n=1 Tax=Klenkia sp. PcliD-1-E TaxID=2954492 RepID=UPI002096DC9C|nr:maleylpyruvate isomerase N-terminal domain-containing protein [Klenkia sp. PcliD-1-E]MCO7219778.1 maleylpyruvate isomerase N-terminal domain-containing protein [Klenkia sp. PcliD-1-E]